MDFEGMDAAEIVKALEVDLGHPLIVVGASSLFQHGWTTQRCMIYEVAVPVSPKASSLPSMHDPVFVPRDKVWFDVALDNIEPGYDGLNVLDPAYALVDAISTEPMEGTFRTVWRPDPDDIEPPGEMTRDEFLEAVLAAGEALGADVNFLRRYVQAAGDKFGPRWHW